MELLVQGMNVTVNEKRHDSSYMLLVQSYMKTDGRLGVSQVALERICFPQLPTLASNKG